VSVHDLPGQAEAVMEAARRRDRDALRRLLHPYVHWTEADGTALRGRTIVMAHLATRPPLEPPLECEVRDGQLYRWTAG